MKQKMAEIRSPRQQLVHEVHGRFEFLDDYDEAREYMEETIQTVQELKELAEEALET